MPRFSIIVPAHQAALTIAETLDAIVAQTFGDWECIVVDDGSIDGTLQIATTFSQADPRIRVLHQENQGTAGAYNTGVSSATAEYIVLCSADDILLPGHLARMSAFIDSEAGYDIYVSNGFSWRPGRSRDLIYEYGQSGVIHSLDLADVIRVCFYGVGAVYRRELYGRVGGYRLGVFGEDYDFWLRAMALGARHRYLPQPLSLFRVSPTQKSARLETAYRSDIRLVSDLRHDFQLSPADLRAVDESIRDRERLIADLRRPRSLYRDALRPAPRRILFRLVGRERARRVWHGLKAVARRLVSR